MSLGAVRHVYACAWYRMGRPLQRYAESIYAMRCRCDGDGQTMMGQVAKRLLVSLAGKIGQRERGWRRVDGAVAPAPYGHWWGKRGDGSPCRYRAIAWQVERDDSGGWGPEAVPSVACWITSAARVRLWELIERAGIDNVYYVDTDSLLVNMPGLLLLNETEILPTGTMGGLTMRDRGAAAVIRTLKNYSIDDRVTEAGTPRGIMVSAGDGLHHWYLPPPANAAWQGIRPDCTSRLVNGDRIPPYKHGVVDSTGKVWPLTLQEDI